ncbi:MAG: hypothetical protein ACFFD7_17285, partial [Candidatus Thorarchaeota archaeon]
ILPYITGGNQTFLPYLIWLSSQKLYKEVLLVKYPKVPKYEKIEKLHNQRNNYQHGKLSIDHIFHNQYALDYLGLAKDIIKTIDIIETEEDIKSTSYLLKKDSLKQVDLSSKIKKKLEQLRKLMFRLYTSGGRTSRSFVDRIYKDAEIQDYFGISVENDDDKPLYFLDGEYELIPNSITLKWLFDDNLPTIILNKNSSEEIINKILGKFFNRIKEYIKETQNLNLNY